MINFIKMTKLVLFSKTTHFLSLDAKTYFKYRLYIQILIRLNKHYIPCEIMRLRFKHMNNFVVFGLKWNGKNVNRRTNGYAKDWVLNHKDCTCPYCDKKLTKTNATSDHIVPISQKGNNCQVNLIVCCKECNGERGNMDFYAYLRSKNSKYKNMKKIKIFI